MAENIERIALLIDSDNTQIGKIESAILELSKYGKILVKRAYGKWTKDTLKNWEDTFRKLAIKPIQQIDYVKGKNATDMALTIDAMDFLYNSEYDIFALVSSDSDFTPLAIKLRESGKTVIGIGQEKTSEAFVSSCDNFLYLEKLREISSIENFTEEKKESASERGKLTELDKFLQLASDSYQNDEGFVNIGAAGAYIGRVKPDFDIQQYGVKKLPEYLRNNPNLYEIRIVKGKGTVKIIEYKIKE